MIFQGGPDCELIELSNVAGGDSHYFHSHNYVSCQDCYLLCKIISICTTVTCKEDSSRIYTCYFYKADIFEPSGNKDALSWIKKCSGSNILKLLLKFEMC